MDPLLFLAEFRAETAEHLHTLDEQLLRLERDPVNPQAVREMFIAAHSIKGGAAMLGLSELRELSHALEDVLSFLRDEHRPLEPVAADALFRAVDQLRALVVIVDGADAEHPSTPQTVAIVDALQACMLAVTPTPATVLRVLLVEDSPSVRQVETFLLQDAGFVVDVTEAGNEALERARSVHYDLVIAGVETRELRGPDLVLMLRAGESGQAVPVLLTTSDHGPGSPEPTADLIFAPKGRLGDANFLRVVRDLTAAPQAAA